VWASSLPLNFIAKPNSNNITTTTIPRGSWGEWPNRGFLDRLACPNAGLSHPQGHNDVPVKATIDDHFDLAGSDVDGPAAQVEACDSENEVVARLLPAAMGWVCTRDGCGAAVADLLALQTHTKTRWHTASGHKRKRLSIFGLSPIILTPAAAQLRKNPKSKSLSAEEQGPIEPMRTIATGKFAPDTEQGLQYSHTRKEPVEFDGTHEFPCRFEQFQSPRMIRASTVWDLEKHAIQSWGDTIHKPKGSIPFRMQLQPPSKRAASSASWVSCEFSTVSATQKNMKAHTPSRPHTGERLFHCKRVGCPFKSSRSGDLREHTRIHTGEKPFACTWEGCSYACAQSSNLKRHKRVHTGERPYHCAWDSCGYRATTASNLKQHVRTHTHERPFGCTWGGCEYSASRRGELKKHWFRKHKEGVHAGENQSP
jgi:hypothetical protein